MMGLAKMSPDSWAYYAAEIALGEDYFVGHGEEMGRWVGLGAEVLDLSGDVTTDALSLLFGQGRNPSTGEALGHPFPKNGAVPVAGYAISFSPPKSVSVLWALGDEATARLVREAHDAAVDSALLFLQDHAGFTRRGRGGAVQADTDGYVAAAFTHRTSRAGDPQLHTHVLVANKVRASTDGKWLALDGRELFEFQKAAGLVYKAGLRAELTARLGVRWRSIDVDGGGEIDGVPEALVAGFSKRREQVTARGGGLVAEREAALGRSLTGSERAAVLQLAAYQTREAKEDRAYSTEELRARWLEQAVAFGDDPEAWLPAVLEAHARTVTSRARRRSADSLVTEIVAELEETHSTWGRSDVIEALTVRVVPGAVGSAAAVVASIDAAADAVLSHPEVVRLGAGPAEAPAPLRRRDGMAPAERHGGGRYSTRRTLAGEQAILEFTGRGRSAGVAIVDADTVARASRDAALGPDQAAAIARLCRAGERVAVLVGPAGSGKSLSLSAARMAWESVGIRVRGVAPSAVAAGVLAEQAGIVSETLAKFLLDVERGRTRLGSGEVVVCDEASMVSTRDLARLVGLVERAAGKLVLVGDHRQLGSVDAGGLFRLLAADARTAELTTIRRFADPWEADASRRLRAGDAGVLADYQAHHRVCAADRSATLDAAHAAWASARAHGRSVVVMATDHDTVNRLALRARAARIAEGAVVANGIRAGEQTVGIGDEVVTTLNNRRLVTTAGAWVRNGDRWQILELRGDGSVLLDSLDGRGRVIAPAGYVADNLSLAYAVTVHKGQGLTVDEAILVVDDATAAEHLYVGMTRGRQTNRAFVVCEAVDSDHGAGRVPSAYDVLAAALRRSANERSATETHGSAIGLVDDLRTLQAALEEARRHVDAAAGPDRKAEIDRLRRQTAHAQITGAVTDAETRLTELSTERQRALAELVRAHQSRQRAERPRWLRRPDKDLQYQADTAAVAARLYLRALEESIRQSEESLSIARDDQANLGVAALALRQAETAEQAREAWIDAHPEVVDHIVDLAHRVRHAERAQFRGATARQQDPRFPPGTEPSLRRPRRPAHPCQTPVSGADHYMAPLSDSVGPSL